MDSPIVAKQMPRLKRPGKGIAMAIALLVGALLLVWSQRDAIGERKLLELRMGETLTAAEISLREIVGTPPGSPGGFKVVRAYEVRPVDPAMRFSKDFRLNFIAVETGDMEVIRIDDSGWQRVDDHRPWLGKVDLYVESTQPGIYALGRFE
jgi:hypothetical protein